MQNQPVREPDRSGIHQRALGLNVPQPDRAFLESLALEAYREGELSRGQVSELLGLNFFDTEEFLHRHRAMLGVSVTDMERSSAALRSLLSSEVDP